MIYWCGEMSSALPSRSPETFVESFEKGLRVIKAFDAQHPAMTLSEVAERTELTRAAARRLLLTLVELGYAQMDQGRFRLTARVLLLGAAYLRSSSLPELAHPILERVSRALGESSSLAVLDGTDIVYIARNQTNRIMTADLAVGSRLPAFHTSMGRVLLAHAPRLAEIVEMAPLEKHTVHTLTNRRELHRRIKDVRTDGYALVDQELEEGLRSMAVPVRDRSRTVVAAMNVSSQANRVTLKEMKERFLPVLLRHAGELEELLP